MASYKDIQGFNIQNLSSDPVPFAQEKANNPYGGVWSSGGNMNQIRNSSSSAGTQTATIVMGGESEAPLSPEVGRTQTETYNGSTWTTQPATNDQHYSGTGFGTQTSALVAGGYATPTTSNNVELWNGSAWTTTTDMTNRRYTASGSPAGPQSAGIVFGGANTWPTVSGSVTALVESWNGSAWTEVGDLNNTRAYSSGAGTQTAALAISGFVGWTGAPPAAPTRAANVEAYNGTSWTEVGDINQNRSIFNASFGTQTAAVSAGGENPAAAPPDQSSLVESYDGTTWTEVNNLATARGRAAATGTSTVGLVAGGGPPNTTATEEWTFSGIPPSAPAAGYTDAIVGQIYYNTTTGSFKAIGAGVGSWSAGGDQNTLRNSQAGFGTPTAAVGAGGDTAPGLRTTATEEYNGTSWTSVNPLGTARQAGDGTGTQTAGIMAAGFGPASSPITPRYYNFVETYDGTNWTEVAEVNTGRFLNSTVGLQTDAITIGGSAPPVVANTEQWNGSTWTEVNDLNTVRQAMGSGGTTTSAIIAGGDAALPAYVGNVETWNGTSWTETTDLNTARAYLNGSGSSSSSAVVYGGTVPGYVGNTEAWDGSTWTETSDMATGRGYLGATKGSSTAALAISGSDAGGRTLATEEYVLSDFTINTLTTS